MVLYSLVLVQNQYEYEYTVQYGTRRDRHQTVPYYGNYGKYVRITYLDFDTVLATVPVRVLIRLRIKNHGL